MLLQLRQIRASVIRKINAPIAAPGDKGYVIRLNDKTGNLQLLFRASTDGGETLVPILKLSTDGNIDRN